MLKNKVKFITLSVLFILIIFFCIQNDICYKIIKAIFLNKELNVLLVTLIAGLFGFVVAIIPFAIHLLNQNNDFVDKLKEENNFKVLIAPLFNRFFDFLKNMFALFVFLLIFAIARDVILEYFESKAMFEKYFYIQQCIISLIFGVYIILAIKFLFGLYRLILDLRSLVQIFLKTHTKEKQCNSTKEP